MACTTVFEPLPPYGTHLIWEDFVQACKDRSFVNYDGYATLATATQMSDLAISPSKVLRSSAPPHDWVTHVVWFNR